MITQLLVTGSELNWFSQCYGSGSAWICIIVGSWIRIRIKVESWIQIPIEVKSRMRIRIRIRIRIKVKRWKP
jgi:hypothetical protein